MRISADIIYSDYLFVWGKNSNDSYQKVHPIKNKNKTIIAGQDSWKFKL